MSQDIVGPLTITSALGVQGGSLELGATLGPAPETPYVDFHFGLGAAQDFNVRLLNTADNRLDVVTALGGTVLSIQGDKIGIGTTTPGAKLVVNEPAGGAELRVDGLNGTVGLSLVADAAQQPWVGTRTNHALRLLTNNTEQVRVQADGHVGIGNTTPDHVLVVGPPSSGRHLVVHDVPTARWGFATGNFNLAIQNDGSGTWETRLLLTRNGNVGLGTMTPTTATGGRVIHVHNPSGPSALRLGHGGATGQQWEWQSTVIDNTGALNLSNLTSMNNPVTVLANGNVGIGSTAPRRRLDVLGEIVATNRLTLAVDTGRTTRTWYLENVGGRLRIFDQPTMDTPGTERLSIDQGGNVSFHSTGFHTLTVGAGANGALKVRHVNGKHYQNDTDDGLYLNWGTGQPVHVGGVGGDGRPSALLVTGNVSVNGGAVIAGVTLGCDAPGIDYPYQYETIGVAQSTMNLRLQSPNEIVLHTGGAARLTMDNQGRMGMGNTLGTLGYAPTPYHNGWGGGIRTWDVEAHGTIWSQNGYIQGNQDIAENYASAMELEPGDVVCLDLEQDAVILAARPNDRLLLGVVSTTPAMLLNSEVEDRSVFPVALCGRVPCKVTDEGGPIRRGDLLTSSSTPGSAMKARPIRLGDQAVYAPGTILGKALGSLESGCSMIDIFVALR